MANPGACRGKGGADGMGREAAARARARCTVASRAVRVQRPSITRRQTGIARASAGRGKGLNRGHMSAAAAAIAAARSPPPRSGRSPPRSSCAAAAALVDFCGGCARALPSAAALPFVVHGLRQIVGTAFRPLHAAAAPVREPGGARTRARRLRRGPCGSAARSFGRGPGPGFWSGRGAVLVLRKPESLWRSPAGRRRTSVRHRAGSRRPVRPAMKARGGALVVLEELPAIGAGRAREAARRCGLRARRPRGSAMRRMPFDRRCS